MDDLVAKFMPQFVASARAQMAKVGRWVVRRDQAEKKAILREIHSLKGDAGMLELVEVVLLAKDCEEKVKPLHADSTEADVEHVVAALRQLEAVIAGIEAAYPSKVRRP